MLVSERSHHASYDVWLAGARLGRRKIRLTATSNLGSWKELLGFGGALSTGTARVRAVVLTALSSGAAKVITTLTGLVTAPLTLSYLGPERFGLWMTISSLVAFLTFADFGIGNGLVNAVATAFGRNDVHEMRRAIASAAAVLCAITALMIAALWISFPFVPWAAVVNAKSSAAIGEAGPAVAVFLLCSALNVPAGIVPRVQLGLQRGFRIGVWQAAGSLLGLVLLLIAIRARAGLPWLVAALTGGPLLATVANGALFFGRNRPDLRPDPADASWYVARSLARSGALFLVLQVSSAVAFGSDNLIIARVLGPKAVAGYALVCRVFALIQQANYMLVGPLWPAYREAIARGDFAWVRLYFKRSLMASGALAAVLGAGFVAFGSQILHWWVGDQVRVPRALFLSIGVWVLLECLGVAVSMFLFAAGSIGSQAAVASVFAVVCVAARVWAAQRAGVVGVPVVTSVCYVALVLVPILLIVRSRLARLR